MKSKGRRLKELLEVPEVLVSPGIYDGYSTRLVRARGFKSGAIPAPDCRDAISAGPTWASTGCFSATASISAFRRSNAPASQPRSTKAISPPCPSKIFHTQPNTGRTLQAKPILDALLRILKAGGIYPQLKEERLIAPRA